MRNVQSTLLYNWFEEVWNQGKEASIDKLMRNDSTADGIIREDQPKGAEGFKIFFNEFRSQFHDIHVSVEDVIAQDDLECARTIVSAKHTVSGKPVSFSGMCMVKVANGKIAEAWNNFDFLNMQEQLGNKLVTVSFEP